MRKNIPQRELGPVSPVNVYRNSNSLEAVNKFSREMSQFEKALFTARY